MLSGEEKARELAIMQNSIRLVGSDGPGAGGGQLDLVKNPSNNRSMGNVVRGGKDQGACWQAKHHWVGRT